MADVPNLAVVAFTLRRPTWEDVPALFGLECEAAGNEMAGVKPRTREVFFERWREVLADARINSRVIEVGGAFAGTISVFQAEGRDCLGYRIDPVHWGKGLATRAVGRFLADEERRRPLWATAASTNARSLRVLERNGFRFVRRFVGEETERYSAREVVEYVLEG